MKLAWEYQELQETKDDCSSLDKQGQTETSAAFRDWYKKEVVEPILKQ